MVTDKHYIVEIYSHFHPANIYRQVLAYLTGHVGHNDDTSASRFVDLEIKACFEEALEMVTMQEKGWVAPGYHRGNFIVIKFKTRPTQKQISIIKNLLPSFSEAFMEKDELADYIGDTSNLKFGNPRIYLSITEITEICYE